MLLQPNIQLKWRMLGLVVLFVTFFEIVKSRAIQGLVVSAGGIALVGLLDLLAKKVKPLWIGLYVTVISVVATLSIFGALQRGPFTFIYKRSVSLRGTYWESGFEMGMQNPLSGVGMDGYGDWYRRARPPRALTDTPGIETVTNAAHNVFLDIFAYGGFPLLIAYLLVIAVIARSAFNLLFAAKNYDFIGVGLVAVWICYQAQALISINQIGVAIWGWIFGGLIIAYDRILKLNESEVTSASIREKGRISKVKRSSEAGISLATFVGLILAMLIAMPPMIADGKWRNALGSGDAKKLENAATSWPQDPVRLDEAIKIFYDNKLDETALKLSKISTTKFSEYYISWYSYMQLTNITDAQRAYARAQLHRLDPNNPEFKP
jgi:hypothetical protein